MSRFGDRIFMTPQEIYRQLTEGPGPRRLVNEQEETSRERLNENDRADLIRSLANTIRTGWQGDASEGAYGAAMPLAERALENADKLDHSQDLLSRQIDSFNTAANSVRPVSDAPNNPIDEKFPFDVDYDKAVKDYQDSAQHNIAVFREYDGASHYNETNIPQEYSNSTRVGGDVSLKAPADAIEVEEPGAPRSGGPADSAGPWSSSGDGSYPGGPSTGGFPGGSDGSLTGPNDDRPSPVSSYPSPSSSYSPVGQSPVSGGFVGGVPVGGYSGGTGGVRGGGAGLGRGAGARAGAFAAEEAAAARRAAQAAGGAKPGAMGAPMGARRGKDDEDED